MSQVFDLSLWLSHILSLWIILSHILRRNTVYCVLQCVFSSVRHIDPHPVTHLCSSLSKHGRFICSYSFRSWCAYKWQIFWMWTQFFYYPWKVFPRIVPWQIGHICHQPPTPSPKKVWFCIACHWLLLLFSRYSSIWANTAQLWVAEQWILTHRPAWHAACTSLCSSKLPTLESIKYLHWFARGENLLVSSKLKYVHILAIPVTGVLNSIVGGAY